MLFLHHRKLFVHLRKINYLKEIQLKFHLYLENINASRCSLSKRLLEKQLAEAGKN